LADVFLELRKQFGAVSTESQTIHGQWQQQGEIYRDELMRVFVDIADTPENRRFFLQYKEHLKQRFQQLDIWVTSHPIEVL
jgi:hypothetical protein